MIFLSKKICFNKVIGMVIGAVGIGILLSIIIPAWCWLLVIGAGVVYAGWYIAECLRR